MASSTLQTAPPRPRDRWLVLIGGFKLLKGVLFLSLGVGVLRLVHRDVAEFLLQSAQTLGIDPERHMVNMLLEKADALTPHRIALIGYAIFFYALLDFIEGTGLVLEKAWAEYVTIILTASFLPWELFELMRHFTWAKVLVTVVNLIVLLYLLYVQRVRLRRHQLLREQTGS